MSAPTRKQLYDNSASTKTTLAHRSQRMETLASPSASNSSISHHPQGRFRAPSPLHASPASQTRPFNVYEDSLLLTTWLVARNTELVSNPKPQRPKKAPKSLKTSEAGVCEEVAELLGRSDAGIVLDRLTEFLLPLTNFDREFVIDAAQVRSWITSDHAQLPCAFRQYWNWGFCFGCSSTSPETGWGSPA